MKSQTPASRRPLSRTSAAILAVLVLAGGAWWIIQRPAAKGAKPKASAEPTPAPPAPQLAEAFAMESVSARRAALARWAGSLGSRAACTEALEAIAAQTVHPSDRAAAQFLVWARWVELDRRQAWETAAVTLPRPGEPDPLSMVFAAWAEVDAAAAQRQLDELPPDMLARAGELDFRAQAKLAADSADAARLRATFAAWAKADPAAALTAALRLPPGGQRHQTARDAVLKSWLEQDPAGALAAVWNSDRAEDRQAALYALMATVGPAQPQLAAQLLSELPPAAFGLLTDSTPTAQGIFQRYLTTLAAEDPARAGALFSRLSETAGVSALSVVTRNWGAQDPAAALRWSLDLTGTTTSGSTQPRRLAVVASQTAIASAPPEALPQLGAMIAQLPPSSLRSTLTEYLMRAWTSADRAAAAAWLDQHGNNSARETATRIALLVAQADSDLPGATKTALEMPDFERRRALLSLGRERWQTDPAATVAWMQSLPTPHDRVAAFKGFQTAWAKTDPVAAGTTAVRAALEDASAYPAAEAVNVLHAWAAQNPTAAWEQLQPLLPALTAATENDLAASYLQRFFEAWSATDNKAAIATAAGTFDGFYRSHILGALLQPMTRDFNIENSLAWLRTWESEGEGANEVFRQFSHMWAMNEPDKTRAWISELPEGPKRTAALEGFILRSRFGDYPAALALAASESEPAKRRLYQEMVLRAWAQRAPDAAAAARAEQGLPPLEP